MPSPAPKKLPRWLRMLSALLLFCCGLTALAYSLSPWLLPMAATQLAAVQGIELQQFEMRRPGPGLWQIDHLAGQGADVSWSVNDVRLSFHWRQLLSGQIDSVRIGKLEVTMHPTREAAASGPLLDRTLLSALPEQLSPSVWLQRLPWQLLQIAALKIELPGLPAQIQGQLKQTRMQVALEAHVRSAEPQLAHDVRVEFSAAAGLQVNMTRIGIEAPVLAVTSRFQPDAVDINVRSMLQGADAGWLLALLGQPELQLSAALTANSRLPWPLASDFALADILVNGSYQVDAVLPEPAEVSGSLRDVKLTDVQGTFVLRGEELMLLWDSGTLTASQVGTSSSALCTVTEPTVITAALTQLSVSDGWYCQLRGDQGVVRLDPAELSYRQPGPGAPAQLDLQLSYESRVDKHTARGALALALRQSTPEQLTGNGTLSVYSKLLTSAASDKNTTPLAFDLRYVPSQERFELHFTHQFRLGDRVLAQLWPDWDENMDISAAKVLYEGQIVWLAQALTAQLEGGFDAAQLANAPGEPAEALRLRPLAGVFKLSLKERALHVAGSLARGAFNAPYQLDYDLSRGEGLARSRSEQSLPAATFAELFSNWNEPYDFSAGQLQTDVTIVLPADAPTQVSAQLVLGDAKLHYDDYQFHGVSGEFELQAESGQRQVSSDSWQVELVDLGVPITQMRGSLRYNDTGETQRVVLERIHASVLGGVAQAPRIALDLTDQQAQFEVTLHDLSLAEVLALEGDDISGTGLLDGTLPVRINGEDISIKDGLLRSQPPGGVIRLSSELAGPTGQPGLDFAVLALRDFSYDSLHSSVSYQPNGDLRLGVALKGRNPQVEQGRKIHYNLNVSENVLSLLESLQVDQMITEQVERQVNK